VSRFFIGIIATHAGILSSVSSTPTRVGASQVNGMLPYLPARTNRTDTVASVAGLSPVTLSARDRLTSEQLRTL